MRKLEIDMMPATDAQISIDFTRFFASGIVGGNREVTLISYNPKDLQGDLDPPNVLTGGGVSDAVRLKNLQFQNIEGVKSISLVVSTEIAGNIEKKEYDLTPYNTMDAFQREKITLDGSITIRRGTKVSVLFKGIDTAEDASPSVILFADLSRYYCC